MQAPTSNPKWSFLIDENLPSLLARALTTAGYAASAVLGSRLSGKHDQEVFTYARGRRQTIITRDTDFLKAAEFPVPHPGIIVVRIPGKIAPDDLIREVLRELSSLAGQSLAD